MIALSPELLDKMANDLELETGHHNAIVGTVDSNGAKIAAIFSDTDGSFKCETYFLHEWSGENAIGGKLLASW